MESKYSNIGSGTNERGKALKPHSVQFSSVTQSIQVLNATPIKALAALDFPCGLVVKNLPVNARDTSSIPDLGRSHKPRGN